MRSLPWIVLAAGLFVAQRARAEAAAGAQPAPANANTLVAPELLEAAEVPYPEAARAAKVSGDVVLLLTLDAQGLVKEAAVQSGLRADLDEAARQGALQFRFRPALKNGVPIAARIAYTHTFRLQEPQAEPTPEPTPAVAPEAQAASPRAPQAAPRSTTEVVVRGLSALDSQRQSARAVTVVSLDEAKRSSADMGEVLARVEGVTVQRAGGLGSDARVSLNGFSGEQVRLFLDGVPLALAGFPFGIANVPVNLVDRLEVYRGVVPIRFGADALGGALNLVTDESTTRDRASLSYEFGSFDTHRLTGVAQRKLGSAGAFVRGNAFVDSAANDYPIDVVVPDSLGRPSAARVRRFHDGYSAAGAGVEAGFVNRPWAKRLLLRAFVSDQSKEIQNDPLMETPYGGVTNRVASAGGSLRFLSAMSRRASVETLLGYSHARTNFQDVSSCIYDWYGQCVRQRPAPGEIEGVRDTVTWSHSGFGRTIVELRPSEGHTLRFALASSLGTRTGEERRPRSATAIDPLSAQRALGSLVSGVEYQTDALDGALQNIVFVKDYLQTARSTEPLQAGGFADRGRNTHRVGAGDSLRVRLAPWGWAKASYEYATRLPTAEEVFGDGSLVEANLQLLPESSHNANLGLGVLTTTRSGQLSLDLNGFFRRADDLIKLVGSSFYYRYQNVYLVRTTGIEASARWTSRGGLLTVASSGTYQDERNVSDEGLFAAYRGDRLPNRPYLFGALSARLSLDDVVTAGDSLSLEWRSRYVHSFFRSWESLGASATKATIPSQLVHSLGLVHVVRGRALSVANSFEAQNLSDAQTFDFFGVQRPGRAFFVKTSIDFRKTNAP
ncbi:MAG: TonB-dependent siderophore myxochelin receptor MxcH [Polyangiaceae bacterium]